MNTGKVMSIMLTWSTKIPRKISSSIIPARIANGVSPAPRMCETMPSVAPEKLRICEKVVAPRMMKRIIAEMPTVPRNALSSAEKVRER